MNYYSEKLNAQTLFQVYETQIPRVKQYLQAEIEFVKRNLSKGQRVLELGAGYGRIVRELSPFCGSIVGIDISEENVALGRDYLKDYPNAGMVVMDVFQMNFPQAFDVILCLQNGLSAMRADSTVIHKVLETLEGRPTLAVTALNFGMFASNGLKSKRQKGFWGKLTMARVETA